MQGRLLAALKAECVARRPCVLITDLGSGNQRLIRASEIAADPLCEILKKQLRLGKSVTIQYAGEELFLNVQVPPVRLVLIGAVHIAQTLTQVARLADFDVIVIDPRTAFATAERFPETELITEWPEVALPAIGLDSYTALALLTHDPRIDDPALIAALRAKCLYIGALGSRKTHAKRLERMRAAGFCETELAQIRAPIGLDIGAQSSAEIAIAIIGEIIAGVRKGLGIMEKGVNA